MNRKTMQTVLLALLTCACSDSSVAPAAEDPDAGLSGPKADSPDSAFGNDTHTAPDATVEDSQIDADDDAPDPSVTTIRLDNGEELSGELIATYDHNLWWDASDQLTYALFEPDGFFPYPNDHSLRFVSSLDVAEITEATEPAVRPYRQLARERGIVAGAVPFAGIAYVITGNDTYHYEENGSGDFAWDLVVTDANGAYFSGDGTANEDHFVWDEPVYMPVDGMVIEVVRDVPDNLPGSYPDDADENLVGIALGGSFYLYYLHFRQGTIPSTEDGSCTPTLPDIPCVGVGEVLTAGTYLGRVGNSGTTLEPHLHMTMLWWDEDADPPRYWSVPSEFQGVFATQVAAPAEAHDYLVPSSGTWIANGAF